MPDISMCTDDCCPSRAICRRHEASGTVPDGRAQSYTLFRRLHDAHRCFDFLPAREVANAAEKGTTDADKG